jgi:hypothetical protein
MMEECEVARKLFTEEDIRQIAEEGLTQEQVSTQIEIFKKGVSPVTLSRPCIVGDGIVAFSEPEREEFAACYDRWVQKGTPTKFVPASGAASRMFADWHGGIEQGKFDSKESGFQFAGNLKKMPFFQELQENLARRGEYLEDLLKQGKFAEILSCVLTPEGLNYGELPKALIKFHDYPGGSRTALEEHLVEAALYGRDGSNVCRVHFTVSGEHEERTRDFVSRIRGRYEGNYGVRFDVSLSTQHGSTNTIAVDRSNRPVRDKGGALVFRPGGHGSLLENLNASTGDIIFIKNIDNVVPDRLKPLTILYKKALAGYLIALQEDIFRHLRLLDGGPGDERAVAEVKDFCRKKLNAVFPLGFDNYSSADQRTHLFDRLNRPLRVCGMVRNEGEPGGAPFWIEKEGIQSPQVIEAFQVNNDEVSQKQIWSAATHFNPVDIVCSIKDYQSRTFPLVRFADLTAVSVSLKNEKGRKIKALELPGLWNGSMAYWNSAFVEVPLETFNPVKTIDDLLRPQHLPAGD